MGKIMLAAVPVLIGALITAIVGNALVQKWQLRSWFTQQRQLGHQAELEELKRLLEEITTAANNRLFSMRRLSGSLAPGSFADPDALLEPYRNQVAIWNSSLNSFYVRLTLYLDYAMTLRLERDVHDRFVENGRTLEAFLRAKGAGARVSWTDLAVLNDSFSTLQGLLFNFSRDLSKRIDFRRSEIFYGKRVAYRPENLAEYSTFQLFKALFTPNVDQLYIVRPA